MVRTTSAFMMQHYFSGRFDWGPFVLLQALLPLSKLYEIDQRSLSVQEIQHLTVFLQKLSGCQTGYTALGIFTIDMTTILSVSA